MSSLPAWSSAGGEMPEKGEISAGGESAPRRQKHEVEHVGHQTGSLEAKVEKAGGEIGGGG
jgi:hypothetical protein